MKKAGASILIFACLLNWFGLAFGQRQSQTVGTQSPIDCSSVGIDFIDNPNMTREERLEAMDQALQKSLGLYDLCQENISNDGGTLSASDASSGGMSGTSSANGSGAGSGGMAGEGSTNESGKDSGGMAKADSANESGNASGEMDKAGSANESGNESSKMTTIGSVSESDEDGNSAASGMQTKAGNHGLADGTTKGAPVSSVATSDIKGTGGSMSSTGAGSNHENSTQRAEAENHEQGGQQPAQKTGDNARVEGEQSSPQGGSSGSSGAIPEDVKKADNDSVLEAQIREAAMREKDPEVRARLWNEYRRYKGLPQK